jgi:hypothetical protein
MTPRKLLVEVVSKVIVMKKTPVIPASEPESRRFWTPGQARGDIPGHLRSFLVKKLEKS